MDGPVMEEGMRDRQRRKPVLEEDGMMVVEAVLTFTVFLVVVLAIIYLINVFTIHNRIQFAIHSAAHELAAYTYLYQALGVRSAEKAIEEDGSQYTGAIDDTVSQVMDTLNKIQGLQGDVTQLGNDLHEIELSQEYLDRIQGQLDSIAEDADQTLESAQKSVEDVTNLFSDADSLIAGVIYMGASGASYAVKSVGATLAAGALTKKYLKNGGQSADAYLKSYGIAEGYRGLDFSGSTMFCDEDMRIIDIVVEYDIDMSFLGLVMPEPKLHVVQRVSVPAWLDGDGKSVSP